MALDPHIIRKNLARARKRASYPRFFPKGVRIQDMEKFWHKLQFNPVAPTEVPFKAELFRPPPTSVRLLRRLSRRGRAYLEHTMCKQEGRPKLVLGLPNDAQEVAPLVASAHRPCLSQNGNWDAVDNNTTTTHPTESRPESVQRPGELSGVDVATVASENQATAQKVMDPLMTELQTERPINAEPASKQQSQIIGQTTRAHAVSSAIIFGPETNASSGDDHIPETTLLHLEEMLSEDQRRIVEEQDDSSAIQTDRARSRRCRALPTHTLRPRSIANRPG